MNEAIGDVASDARSILSQDKWDVFGRGIAQKMSMVFEDEADQLRVAGQIITKVWQDGYEHSSS
jgi:hypothetical protein